MGGTLQVAVLGPPAVILDGTPLVLRPREASVVAALAVDHEVVPSEVLAARIWDSPPPTARKSIQNHVARIRHTAPALIETAAGGYVLGSEVEVDARRFATVVSAPVDLISRQAAFTEALGWWHGPPFQTLTDGRDVQAARSHLCELHWRAEEHLVALDLLSGAPDGTADAERLVAAEPYRERRWWLLILARYRAGRRRDALEAFQHARRTLAEQVGIEPGAELLALDAMILGDDPVLLGPALLSDLVGPEAVPVARTTEADPVVTGRDVELTRLVELTERAKPVTVRVVGEAGIGKTSLGRAVQTVRRQRGGEAVWTFGSRTPDGPLAPVVSLIDDLVHRSAVPITGWLGSDRPTGDQLKLHLQAASGRSLVDPVGDAVAALLVATVSAGPPVVIVDDAQWVQPSSARALATACRAASCHLVLLARPGPLPAALDDLDAEVVTLLGLSPEAVARHLGTLTTQPLGDDVVAELHRRSGGNPLLLGELVGSLIDQGRQDHPITVASLQGSERLTPTVAELARQRVSELAGPTRQVVEAASVVGAAFTQAVVEEVAGSSASALAEAHAGGLLAPAGPGVWHFRHGLIRDAIYADLNPAVRAELHDAVAASLERADGSNWEQIAHHRLRADELHPEATMTACRRAAEEASAQFAHREAAGHLERLGHLLIRFDRGGSVEALDAEIGRGEALHYAGDATASAALLAAADRAEAQGEADRFGRALLCLSRLGPNTDAAAPEPEIAARIDRALSSELTPAVHAELAGAASLLHSMGEDHERCNRLYEDAVRTARRGAPEVLVRVLPFAYLGLGHPRHLDRRAAVAEELYDLTEHEPAGRFSSLHLRFSVEVQRGNPAFRTTHAAMAALAAEMADPGHRWTDAYNRACVSYLDGDLRAAEDAAEISLSEEGIAASRRMAIYGVQLVGLRRSDGRLGELDEQVRRLAADQPDVAGWKAVEVACAAAAGDLDRAAAIFDQVAADGFAGLPDDYTHSSAALLLADGALVLADPERLDRVVTVLEPLAGLLSWSGTTTLGPIDTTLGQILALLGRRDPALRALLRAQATGHRMRAPLIEAAAAAALDALS